jgi:long-chain acyl-CoA synthetase
MTPSAALMPDLEQVAGQHPQAVAYRWQDRECSHAQFLAAVRRQAWALENLGLRHGDRLAVLSANRPEVMVLLAACAWLGLVLVPLNPRLSANELGQQLRDTAPGALVIEPGLDLPLPTWAHSLPCLALPPAAQAGIEPVSSAGVAVPPTACPTQQMATDPHVPVLMLFTAAVTGRARAAVLSQGNLLAAARALGQVWALGPLDRYLGVLPLCHAAGLGLCLALQLAGGASVLMPQFHPKQCAHALASARISVVATFSPMLSALLDAVQAGGQGADHVRIVTGLESPETLARLSQEWPRSTFWSAYGQAEVSSMVCVGPAQARPGAAGKVLNGCDIAVFDALGQALDIGEEGEIGVRGPTVFCGYWDPERAQAVATTLRQGWHMTGDLGRLDADGWLWFTGRAAHKQLIKTGGENVYPLEVEQALLSHVAVQEAYVHGRPDPKWGESVHAVCALRPSAQVTAEALMAHVTTRLARHKRPQTLTFAPAPLKRFH